MYHSASPRNRVILSFAVRVGPLFSFFAQKMHLIHWVLGGFTNIAIKQSQCFYCALDLKIEAGLTAGSRRTYGKGLVFVCLCGDEWPVSTRWLVCTIKLSKRKDFSLIVPFREELWNSELFATAMELAGLRRGEGEGQTEFSSLRPVWHSSQRGRGDKCGPISYKMGRLISTLHQMKDVHAMALWFNKLGRVYASVPPRGFTKCIEIVRKCATTPRMHHLHHRHKKPKANHVSRVSNDQQIYFPRHKSNWNVTKNLRALHWCTISNGQISPIAGAACHDCHAPTRKPPSFLLNLYSSANVLCYMLTTWPDPFNRQQQICVDSNTRLLCAHYAAALTWRFMYFWY